MSCARIVLISALGLFLSIAIPQLVFSHYCGDGEVNLPDEECDQSDDVACPGMCSSTCKCAVCGDGELDSPVEQCDADNDYFCPANCQPDCRCPVCGNGIAEFPETCDAADDAGCPGQCSQQCRCPSPCGAVPEPATACREAGAGKAAVEIKDADGVEKDRVKWKWGRGEATAAADFLDPAGSDAAAYGFCLYDGALQPLIDAEVLPMGTCADRPCWAASGANGFKYKNHDATPDGVTDLRLKAGDDGRAQIKLKARGANLTTPVPGLRLPITVQLVIDDGVTRNCWQTVYTDALTNAAGRFKASGP